MWDAAGIPIFAQNFLKMTGNRTFTMIKPDAVEKGHIGPILEKITTAGFKIVAMKYTLLSRRDAELFYAIHKERPFFGELVDFMTRGPIVAAILEKPDLHSIGRFIPRSGLLKGGSFDEARGRD